MIDYWKRSLRPMRFMCGSWALRPSCGKSAVNRSLRMENAGLITWLTIIDTICWGICFWWMYTISSKQKRLLKQLGEQAGRIEKLSRAEHDLICEVHPQVEEIKEGVHDVKQAVEHPNLQD